MKVNTSGYHVLADGKNLNTLGVRSDLPAPVVSLTVTASAPPAGHEWTGDLIGDGLTKNGGSRTLDFSIPDTKTLTLQPEEDEEGEDEEEEEEGDGETGTTAKTVFRVNTGDFRILINGTASSTMTRSACKTEDAEKDDFVFVPPGATAVPELDGTVNLDVRGAFMPEIALTVDPSPNATVSPASLSGTTVEAALTGKAHSSARDDTKVTATATAFDPSLKDEEDFTVCEGVEIEFEGVFYSPIDGRDFGFRPTVGVTYYDSAGNPVVIPRNVNTPLAGMSMTEYEQKVFEQDTVDYTSRISFFDNDQPIPRRSWSRTPEVRIRKITTQQPTITLESDPLVNAEVHCVRGKFEQKPLGGADEKIITPKFELIAGGVSYLFIENGGPDTQIISESLSSPVRAAYEAAVTPPVVAGPPSEWQHWFSNESGWAPFRPDIFRWENNQMHVKGTDTTGDSKAAL